MRIAFFSPLRPRLTGVADYSEEILPVLARFLEIDLFVDGYEPCNPAICDHFALYEAEDFARRHARRPYDALIYQMGNNTSHRYIYNMLQRYPGIVVLHDSVLHHFLGAAFLGEEPDLAAYQSAFPQDVGASLLRRREAGLWSEVDHFVFAGVDQVLASSQALVVHSRWAQEQLRWTAPDCPAYVVPLCVGTNRFPFAGLSPVAIREQLGLPDDAVVLSTFGFVTEGKRFRAALLAYRELLETNPQARYLIVGETNPFFDVQQVVRDLGLEGLVWVTGHLSAEVFYALIDATDICLQLRYPSAGEMSSAILRVMSRGKPVLLSNYQQFGEFPDDCCLKVDLGPAEVPLLANYLRRLAKDAPLRRRIGENARRYVATHNSVEQTVRGYLRVLEQVTGRPPCAPPEDRLMGETKQPQEWLDVPALMAAIRRELARQAEAGQLASPGWEHYRTATTDLLMDEIRSALAERWHAGQLVGPDLDQYHVLDGAPQDLEKNLKLLNDRWNQVYEPLSVQSRTPLVGRLWANLRRRIHEEVRSYLDPMVYRQADLNAAIVSGLNMLTSGFYGGSLARSLQTLHGEVVALREQVCSLEERLRAGESEESAEESV